MLAKCALENLLELEAKPELPLKLATNVRFFKEKLISGLQGTPFELLGHKDSPLFFIKKKPSDKAHDDSLIQAIVAKCQENGLFVVVPATIKSLEHVPMSASIKIVISASHTINQLEDACKTIARAIREHQK